MHHFRCTSHVCAGHVLSILTFGSALRPGVSRYNRNAVLYVVVRYRAACPHMHMNDKLPNRTGLPAAAADADADTAAATEIPGRRWYRYPVDLSLRVQVPTSTGLEYMLAHGRDVSQGGMAVYVPVELNIGDTVLLELIFPGLPEPVTLSASLKNRTGFKYGVEFVSPTAEQQATILGNIHRVLTAQLAKEASNKLKLIDDEGLCRAGHIFNPI